MKKLITLVAFVILLSGAASAQMYIQTSFKQSLAQAIKEDFKLIKHSLKTSKTYETATFKDQYNFYIFLIFNNGYCINERRQYRLEALPQIVAALNEDWIKTGIKHGNRTWITHDTSLRATTEIHGSFFTIIIKTL